MYRDAIKTLNNRDTIIASTVSKGVFLTTNAYKNNPNTHSINGTKSQLRSNKHPDMYNLVSTNSYLFTLPLIFNLIIHKFQLMFDFSGTLFSRIK